MSDEVMKSSESTAHSISDLTKQIDRLRRKMDADASSSREGQQVIELEIAVSVHTKDFPLLNVNVDDCNH